MPICSVVAVVITLPTGSVTLSCGSESAGSAAIFAGAIDSDDVQETTASAAASAMNDATASRARGFLFTASLLYATSAHLDSVVELVVIYITFVA
jgi:hypothetical protein